MKTHVPNHTGRTCTHTVSVPGQIPLLSHFQMQDTYVAAHVVTATASNNKNCCYYHGFSKFVHTYLVSFYLKLNKMESYINTFMYFKCGKSIYIPQMYRKTFFNNCPVMQ
jgi:hypothetical protein